MPLTFDDRGLLPEGIHEATVDEIERELGSTTRRQMLVRNLKEYLSGVRLTGWDCDVLVDGSFIMPKVAEPNDIDLILVLPRDWDLQRRDFRAFEYNTLDRGHSKRNLKIEVYPVLPDSEQYSSYFNLFRGIRIEWCQMFGWPAESRKGIVRVRP